MLAGIVWKFFERVESVLTDQTKLEIAVWLLGVKFRQKIEPWPDTFAKVFDRVFGEKHLSWKCFWRSSVASTILALVSTSLIYCNAAEFSIQFDFRYHIYDTPGPGSCSKPPVVSTLASLGSIGTSILRKSRCKVSGWWPGRSWRWCTGWG